MGNAAIAQTAVADNVLRLLVVIVRMGLAANVLLEVVILPALTVQTHLVPVEASTLSNKKIVSTPELQVHGQQFVYLAVWLLLELTPLEIGHIQPKMLMFYAKVVGLMLTVRLRIALYHHSK